MVEVNRPGAALAAAARPRLLVASRIDDRC